MNFNDIIGDLTPEQHYALQQIPESQKVNYIAGLINAKMNKDGISFGDKLKDSYYERNGSMRNHGMMQMGGSMQEAPITDVPQEQQEPIEQETPQEQGGEGANSEQLEVLITEAAKMLQQGNQPEQVMQFLIEQGLDQNQAQMIVEEIMNQLSNQSNPEAQGQGQMQPPQAPMQQAPMSRMGGSINNYY